MILDNNWSSVTAEAYNYEIIIMESLFNEEVEEDEK